MKTNMKTVNMTKEQNLLRQCRWQSFFNIRKNSRIIMTAACIVLIVLCFAGCGQKKAQYSITAEGTVNESGVIEFAGLEMNVYKDQASNPCGDCPDQPVSIYAGTESADVVSAMAEAVERADDLWQVESQNENTLVLIEKEIGTVEEKPVLSAPSGLTLTGEIKYISGKAVSSDSEKNQSSQSSATREITNTDGTVITVPEKAERVAAVYGPSYEAAVVLGAEDRIAVCADVQFENFPWALKIFKDMKELPYLSNVHSSVNFEELQTYSPDLVLTFNRPNELNQLKKAGIPAVNAVTSEKLQDTVDFLKVYAQALGGDAPEHAQKYADYFAEKLKMVTDITSQIPDEKKPAVYYSGIDILTTYGKYSDICEAVEAAGGKCVTDQLEAGNHAQVSFEQLAAWNPEYIFIDHGGMNDKSTAEEILSTTERNTRYAAIKAVKDQKLYLTPSGVFYWDMGLQKILLVMYMAKTIHPEEFAALDMNAEVCQFYSEFFNYDLTENEAQMILSRENPS